ncbi:ABC transporter permease [Microbacterium sp. RD1]|uniref:ABC transporter permease n=1 Tax=Microbacterium sp. RD1 TaxID=3457313 RepID=UPI003FA58031
MSTAQVAPSADARTPAPARAVRRWRRPDRLVPAVALTVVAMCFVVLPLLAGRDFRVFDLYNGFQGFAQFGFVALALGLTMMAGEFDLSVGGMAAVGGVIAVSLGAEDPLFGVLAAVGTGLAVGLVQGGVIAATGISSLPVTLGTLIVLLGLANLLSGGLSLSYPNTDATLWVDEALLGVFSPRSLLLLALFALAALVFGGTRLGRDLRAVGGDRRAARVSGVRVRAVLTAVFGASGALAATGGALLAYSYSSANPDPGQQLLIVGVVAALLGGVSLAGGRGRPLGLLCGAIAVAFLTQLTTMLALPAFVTQLAFAAFLVLIVVLDAPGLAAQVERLVARRR